MEVASENIGMVTTSSSQVKYDDNSYSINDTEDHSPDPNEDEKGNNQARSLKSYKIILSAQNDLIKKIIYCTVDNNSMHKM